MKTVQEIKAKYEQELIKAVSEQIRYSKGNKNTAAKHLCVSVAWLTKFIQLHWRSISQEIEIGEQYQKRLKK